VRQARRPVRQQVGQPVTQPLQRRPASSVECRLDAGLPEPPKQPMLCEECKAVVIPGIGLPATAQPVVAVPPKTRMGRSRVQVGERVRKLLPEGLGARPRPQHRQHKQLSVRQNHLGCRHAAELAQGGQPFGLRDEDVVGRRIGECLDEHRGRVPAGGHARERRDSTRHRLHHDDIAHPGP